MNQDFIVQTKAIFVWKKNSCRGVHLKKKILHKQWAKKKNSCKLKIPHSPIIFLMVRPLDSPFLTTTLMWLLPNSHAQTEPAMWFRGIFE